MRPPEHVGVKLFLQNSAVPVPWAALIPIFHRWIQTRALPETLIDVADYAHVPQGPGILLVAHEAFYSVDNRQGRPGLLYARRTEFEGSFSDKLKLAHDRALAAARLLEAEPTWPSELRFDLESYEVSINDRLLAPNAPETWEALRPDLEHFAGGLGISWLNDPKALFRAQVQPTQPSAAL